MPKKIQLAVVHVTSEDPKFRATELNVHGPTVKGWQSARNCVYPQEVVIQLEKRCTLKKIQILAHQYLIPSRIELYASNEDTNTVEEVSKLAWDYLGYITLSNNQSTGFKSRELKSANVPPNVASYVKLTLGKNHPNSHNSDNQVSLIAVNLLGIETREINNTKENKDVCKHETNITDDPEYYSPYDDLAFEMYVDVDVAKIIREMEVKKHSAVISERFEYARKLKQAMERLKEAGEKLGKYELEKRHAIELEDYERARHKKNQIDEYRNNIYSEICIDQLLETEGHCPKNDECIDDPDCSQKTITLQQQALLSPTLLKITNEKRSSSPQIHHQNHQQHQQLTQQVNNTGGGVSSPFHVPRHQSPKKGSPSTGSPTNFQNRGSFRRRNKSAGAIIKSTYEMYEEKPLPALRHSQTNEFLRECQLDGDYRTTSKLTEREKKQAALPILVFGHDLVEKFYSKHYCDKEEGLNQLKEELLTYDNTRMHTANKTARAAIFLLHRTLRDKVFSVYNLANEVIRLFFVQFVPGRVSPAEVSRSVDKLLPELLTKSGDTSARIHHMAVHTILTMADCKNVRGLTCRTLSEFGSSGLHHPTEAVRKVSERILVLVYKVNPRLVRKQLPPDDDITRRNLLYRQLFHEFDKIDLQRKKEMLEKTRVIQQCTIQQQQQQQQQQNNNSTSSGTNDYLLSPEPTSTPNELSKCQSASNIQGLSTNNTIFNYDEESVMNGHAHNTNGGGTGQNVKNYAIAKSLSGDSIHQSQYQQLVQKQNGVLVLRGSGNQNNNGNKVNSGENGDGSNKVGGGSSSSASVMSSPSNNSNKEEDEKQCIFCNQPEQQILSISNSMNSHYWRMCPMLVRCKECSQVVEVSQLTEHLLVECERRDVYTQCSRCTEAVKMGDIKGHANSCRGLTEGCNRCPLCHENLEDEERCWKKHLMGDRPCLMNTRFRLPNLKQVTIQI